MISVVEEEQEKDGEERFIVASLSVCMVFSKTWQENELDFSPSRLTITAGVFFFSPIRKRSSQLNY